MNRLLTEKREEILNIARKHGAANVRMFGSMVREDATSESDVDFLVDVLPAHSGWFPGGLIAELQELLGRRVDVVEPQALHWYFRDRVMSEATPL